MKKILIATLITALSLPALARDEEQSFPIADALNAPAAQEKLDKDVKLYFGKQKHPAVIKKFGEWGSNKKTNAFNKSDKAACEWTFLSAVLSLQERARKEGANAVIDIKSNYKSRESSSESEYVCGTGALMSGVAFKGTMVRIK